MTTEAQHKAINTKGDQMPEVIFLILNLPTHCTQTDLSVGAPSQVPHPAHLGEGTARHRAQEP